ncbi:MAG: NUDIX hydrolase [Patescibacteria group bacterium]
MLKIIIASGPVIVENGKVLLNKHGEDNFWKFCGGRVEDYELDIKGTARREVKEEMGLKIEILDNQPYFFYTEKEVDGVKASVILVHFLAKRVGEVIPGKDIRDWRWVDLADLTSENLAPNIKPALKYFGFIK